MLIIEFCRKTMPEGETQIYLHAATKREVKARSALEGLTMKDYIQELIRLTKNLTLKEIESKVRKEESNKEKR